MWLPSGGTLVIDRTEAMTVVDVNTGKFTGSGGNLEQTVTKNNLEAAEEIVRQLRLRDIGGIVVIDFIDMVLESNRDLVLRRLTEALARDRTRHQVSEVTSLGLVQLTRKRLGTGLIEAFSTSCTHCGGRGILLHADPVDSAPSNGRKSESGGRRGKRSKKKGRPRSRWWPRCPRTPPASTRCSRRWPPAGPRRPPRTMRNPTSPPRQRPVISTSRSYATWPTWRTPTKKTSRSLTRTPTSDSDEDTDEDTDDDSDEDTDEDDLDEDEDIDDEEDLDDDDDDLEMDDDDLDVEDDSDSDDSDDGSEA